MSNVTVMRIGPVSIVVDNLHKIEPAGESAIRVTYTTVGINSTSGAAQLISEVINGCSYEQFWTALRSSPARSVEAATDG